MRIALSLITRWAANRYHGREGGQTVIEYALVIAVVSIALIALMVGFGGGLVDGAAEAVNNYIPGGGDPAPADPPADP